MIIIGLIVFIVLGIAYYFHKTEKANKEAYDSLPLHKKYPQILEWQEGDYLTSNIRHNVYYKGVVDNKFVISDSIVSDNCRAVEPKFLIEEYSNDTFKNRVRHKESERLKIALSNDVYNLFLKEIKAENEKIYQRMLDGSQGNLQQISS